VLTTIEKRGNMQLVKKATVRKMVVDGTLYGRIQCVVPGWLVGKEVVVIIWTEPTIEEATLRKKGVKLWRQDEHGNIIEVVPENIRLQPKEKKQKEVKLEEKPIEEIEIKPKEEKPWVNELLEKIKREQELKEFLKGLDKEKLKGIANV
jgi:hypothetical protein